MVDIVFGVESETKENVMLFHYGIIKINMIKKSTEHWQKSPEFIGNLSFSKTLTDTRAELL